MRFPWVSEAGRISGLGIVAACLFGLAWPAAAEHGIALHGEPLYPPDFEHFNYVNPQAPKGGTITYGLLGSFDSLNPFVVKGASARGLRDGGLGNNVIESLMTRGRDEPFTLYGLLAESVDMPEDRTSITFRINPLARFSDDRPVTADDVVFSLELLRDQGRPNHRSYYSKVTKIDRVDDRTVTFHLGDGSDRELPLILGLMPVLAKHATDPETFQETTLQPMIGSGPYRITGVEPGKRIVLTRNPDYWAQDLPAKRGFHNFDEIRMEYYRDNNSRFEAFKKGLYDVNPESDPGRWRTAYEFPAVADGRVVKDVFTADTPKGMFGFVYNTRRQAFQNIRVREALSYAFDFEWINANLYGDAYRRTASFFMASELSSHERSASPAERALLEAAGKTLPPAFLDGTWAPPVADGSGRDRRNLRKAFQLLQKAGFGSTNGQMTDSAGAPFEFEILVVNKDSERLALAFKRMLAPLGIVPTVRLVDSAQYQRRLQAFDYDMILSSWYVSLSPGNEQSFRWSSTSAGREGSFNFAGVTDPAADALIEAMLAARTREDFVAAVRAFDRVLLSGHYVIPLFYLPDQWVARWAHIERPETTSLYGYRLDTWWRRP
ncbi:MAG: extracellular solute-binding protein [Pseudomonadota bacterium]